MEYKLAEWKKQRSGISMMDMENASKCLLNINKNQWEKRKKKQHLYKYIYALCFPIRVRNNE